MQDWVEDDKRAGRPAVAFGRRVARIGTPAAAPARPAALAEPGSPPVRQPAPKPLPLSSQQLQLFAGPMGTRGRPPQDPHIPASPASALPAAAIDPPPLMPSAPAMAPPRMRGGGRKILAAVIGAVLGAIGGSIAVEAGRMVGAAQRVAPMALEGDAAARPWQRHKGWPAADYSRFSDVATERSPARPAQAPRVANPGGGDPAKGAELTAAGRGVANCVACHVIGDRGTNLPGNVGPDLSEVAKRGRSDEYLFNYVYDARLYNPKSVMPPWGTHGVFSEDDIRHIVAYLRTLKAPAKFRNPLDDPAKRPVPEENRDNLDPMVNPGMWEIDKAKELWNAKGPTGAACVSCHHTPDPEIRFKAWAASMPRWDRRLEKVLGIEEFVYRHAKATTGHAWLMSGDSNVAMATYLRNLANGATIAVDVAGGPAKAAFERGKALMERKIGRLNLACADCHSSARSANRWVRGQWLSDAKGYTVHFPTWRTSRSQLWDIRKRFQWCNIAVGANDLPPDAKEYGDLELYLTSLSNGLKLSVPGIRP